MRQWLEAGYFKGDLPISQDPKTIPFIPLINIFPDVKTAFHAPGPSAEEDAAKAAAEKESAERQAAAEKAAADKAQSDAMEKKQQQAQKEQQKAAKATEGKADLDQSVALKQMLGLGQGSGGGTAAKAGKEKVKQKSPKAAKVSSPSRVKEAKPAPVPAPAAASAGPAWGGAAAGVKTGNKKKSMSEIQQEEARVAARLAKDNKGKSRSSSGWANIAATGGTSAWSGGQVAASAPLSTQAAAPRVSGAKPTASMQQVKARQQAQVAAAHKQVMHQKAKAVVEGASEFGENGKMSSSLETWCKDQMRVINGSDDLTLVSFCMTLSDQAEIKQYLTAYLGSTPQVNNFAAEFINRKDGNKNTQGGWETTVSTKKGRKKKGGN